MAASLGPSWSLRSNASPRCLTAYATTTNSGSISGGDPSNPFDDESTTSSSHHNHGGAPNNNPNTTTGYVHSVAFGTERGSLHYRQYSPTIDAADNRDGSSGGDSMRGYSRQNQRGGYHAHDHHRPHHHRDPSQVLIDPESTSTMEGQINLQGAVKGSIVGIARATLPPSSNLVSTSSTSNNAYAHASASNGNANNSRAPTPVFLLLVDDNRGSSSASSSNPGAYAAHLVTIKHGAFNKLPAVAPSMNNGSNASSPDKPPLTSSGARSHRRGGSHNNNASGGGGGSGNVGSWFGGGESTPRGIADNMKQQSATPNTNTPSTTSSSSQSGNMISLGTLPRMSCIAYHPCTGYVYAAGTGVYGLSNAAVRAVLAGMMAGDTSNESSVRGGGGGGGGSVGGGPFHHSANASVSSSSMRRQQQHGHSSNTAGAAAAAAGSSQSLMPPTAIYHKCNHSLPLPGVRCSSGSSNTNSMALACGGRVAIVAVSNAFYAVPCCLDVGVLKCHLSGSAAAVGGAGGGFQCQPTTTSSLPNVTASKILTFAQSSQVHPVIAMEVSMPSSSVSQLGAVVHAGSSSTSDVIAKYLRPTTSLLFLASGRECTTLEITNTPNSRAVSALSKGGSIVGSSALVSTSIKSSVSKHGMATLPSPILAAATTPPTTSAIRTISAGGNRSRTNNNTAGEGGGGELTSGPMVALLTVDGLVHIRSPYCIAVPMASIEVGTRPNDFYTLCTLPIPANRVGVLSRTVVATSYGGEARLLSIQPESSQDFADRLIKLCIDAFGANGFPRLELAEAMGATFSATSYTGPEPTSHKRSLLRQYLESVLGIGSEGSSLRRTGSSSGNVAGLSFVMSEENGQENGMEVEGSGHLEGSNDNGDDAIGAVPTSSSLDANSLLTCAALLCLVCYQLTPAPNGTAACRASKVCASSMGIVPPKESQQNSGISKGAVAVCELVADRLLKEVSTSFSLLTSTSSSAPITSSHNRPGLQSGATSAMEFVESAIWLLRSCGCHDKAIAVLQERMNSPAFRNATIGDASISSVGSGAWSQIKFDSYLATHLGELWSSKDDTCCQLVLRSPATKDLIARNPMLGLSVFTTSHPQNETEWKRMKTTADPLAHPLYPPKVVELLKSVMPNKQQQHASGSPVGGSAISESYSSFSPKSANGGEGYSGPLPIDSGRALAVSYLESAIGIATGRPHSSSSSAQGSSADSMSTPYSFRGESSSRDEVDERKADMHDELSYLLLEGVISERGDEDGGEDSDLGALYRFKLRRLLSWPNSKIRSERLLGSLPSSFLREHALLLGRLGRHEDALQILYSQENSLELALEYCDVRHERQQMKYAQQVEEAKARGGDNAVKLLPPKKCAYIPLVKVALSSDPDSDRGTAAAIQVLALRRDSIDKAAALRLLPKNIPMSSVVRPFLIPAVVENESQVRRLTVASSLMRSRYMQLKLKLNDAQLKSQSTLQGALALKRLSHLGDPLYSSKPVKARPVHAAASHYYPDVMLVKHFFPRYLVIQAQIMNTNSMNATRTLADVAFVIAESSDEALVPTMDLPLKTVPPGASGSVWCILAASPQRLDGAAFLTCELRFTVLDVDAATGTPLNFSEGANAAGFGRTYVEELQDIEVRHSEFG